MERRESLLLILLGGAFFFIFGVFYAQRGFCEEKISNDVCLTCHPNVQISKTVHAGKNCVDCHRDVKKVPHETVPGNIDCTLCHQSMGENLGMDVHARARKKGNLKAPDCTTCHGAHNVAPRSSPDSPMNPKNMQSFCVTCHPHVPIPATYHKEKTLKSVVCQSCHGEKGTGMPYVDFKEFRNSIHNVLECVDCHSDVKEVPHEVPLKEVTCGNCHQGDAQLYAESIHGQALQKGVPEAPQCWNCHGTHGIQPAREPVSKVNPKNIPQTCGDAKCHSSPQLAKKYGIPIENPYLQYSKSIHAEKLREGNLNSATCVTCHGGHQILPLTDQRSTIFKGNVPKTCSQCHKKTYEDYIQSIHWKGYLKGAREAPVCTDCHQEHEILSPDNPKSTVYRAKVPTLCTDCHQNTRIAERYGISVMSLDSYLKSYHGLALKAGNLEAATCTSCHEQHRILPSSDPNSTVNPNNLKKTCGKCHPGVGEALKGTKIHKESPGIGGRIIEIVKTIYIWVISIAVFAMLAFTLMDLGAKTRRREIAIQKPKTEPQEYYLRFNLTERILHLILFISFVLLAYTGFAHKYPDSAWAYPVSKWLPFVVRDVTHRVAGVLLIANILTQFAFLIFSKRAREQFIALLPRKRDISDAVHMFCYNLGAGKHPPHFSRFNFIEKFEYWALVWGSIIMGITGLGMWFKNAVLSFSPEWIIDLFLVIHFYEALLATLSVLIWHFYWTIFNPHVYPMDTIWIDGKISEERLKEEHPAEWEEIMREKEQQETTEGDM